MVTGMMIKPNTDGTNYPFKGIDPNELLKAGLNPLALLTSTHSNVSVDEGVIRNLLAKAQHPSKYSPNSKGKRKDKSVAVNDEGISSSPQLHDEQSIQWEDEDLRYRDVPSESVRSAADDIDKLTTWLEFHSVPRKRNGAPLYYEIIDHYGNDVRAETRQRCLDLQRDKQRSQELNLAKAGKSKRRKIKGKRKTNKALSAQGKVLSFDADPYVREIFRRFAEKHFNAVYIERAAADHEEKCSLRAIENLEQHLKSDEGTPRPVIVHDTFNSHYEDFYQSAAANDSSATDNSMVSRMDQELLEQEKSQRDLVCNYTPDELQSSYELRSYYNTLASGLGTIRGDQPLRLFDRTHLRVVPTAKFCHQPKKTDSQLYAEYLLTRTRDHSRHRDLMNKRLEETDPLRGMRTSNEAGEFIPFPLQVNGSKWATWAHSKRAKAIQQGTIKRYDCFRSWSQSIGPSESRRYIDDITYVVKAKSVTGDVSWTVYKLCDDLSHGLEYEAVVDYADEYIKRTGSFSEYVNTEQLILDKVAAYAKSRTEFTHYRFLRGGKQVQRCKDTGQIRVCTRTTEDNGTIVYDYLYPEIRGKRVTFAQFEQQVLGIQGRAGTSQEHANNEGSPDMTTVVDEPDNTTATGASDSPKVEVAGGPSNVVPFPDVNEVRKNQVSSLLGKISSVITDAAEFQALSRDERQAVIDELTKIHEGTTG